MDNKNLDNLRHTCAHLLAASVLELWPGTKNAIGPSIENGFYQDFDFGDVKISEEDLLKIEQKMREKLKNWDDFEIKEVSVEQAKEDFKWNSYKSELIDEFAEQGKTITETKQGDFLDLCKGGHVAHPKEEIKHFKLLSIAGAYWRGNEKNKMLTRIYGVAFDSKDALEKYLWQLEEAKKRDHKKLGKELGLFVFSDLVGPGLPLWTPKGTILRTLLSDYIWQLRKEREYEQVTIPHVAKKELYETSGHWQKFAHELFKITSREGHEFAMKPMNCPHHIQIYAHTPRSYKELPQRYTETTMVYRDEQTGELSGLSRVRSATQDDSHVFCRVSQLKEEIFRIWDIVDTFYAKFGFEMKVRLSFHDPENREAYLGTKEVWEYAESTLRDLAKERNANSFEAPGEAAFYGPKLDFMAHDSIGRQWQVATIQLDMNMPERFNLSCINEEGKEERIVMIHCAVMGSIERFLSIVIEHVAGAFPLWLSPVQVALLPISEKHLEGARNIQKELKAAGIRTVLNEENESIGKKIREATLQKVPYMGIIGDKELQDSTVSVRSREGKDMGQQSITDFIRELRAGIEKYA